jgi:selT/selW/selH-like putative selenoprotein
MAEELKKQYNTEVELIPGSGGCFEVTHNGNLIYSKLKSGEFPTIGQLTSAIDATV